MPASDHLGSQFTMKYRTSGPTGYEDREQTVNGPFYHGGRARLGPGDRLTAGRKTNPWGDEGPRSKFNHFTTDKGTAARYAADTEGHVYEVHPTGDVKPGYQSGEYKSPHDLEIMRRVPREEWGT